jgi:hypothetical protein
MSNIDERILVYMALAVICAFVAVFAGPAAATFTFVQIAAVIEALFWFGVPNPGPSEHRQHRILFNG